MAIRYGIPFVVNDFFGCRQRYLVCPGDFYDSLYKSITYVRRQPMSEVVDKVVDRQDVVDNLKNTLSARLKAARVELKMTQKGFAEACEIPLSTFREYELGKSVPGGDAISSIVRVGINANWLLTGEGDMLVQSLASLSYPSVGEATVLTAKESLPPDHDAQQPPLPGGYVALPLYGDVRAAAGYGAINSDMPAEDALMFKEVWIRRELGVNPRNLFLIRVTGDSMVPTLRAGDVILIDQSARRPDHEGIYIIRISEMLLVKRLQALPGGRIRIISDNTAFESFVLDAGLTEDMQIHGRVVWTARKL